MAETGVYGYQQAKCTVTVYFPKDKHDVPDIRCCMCNYWRNSSNRCALNNMVTEYPSKYIGSRCPLEFIEEGGDM